MLKIGVESFTKEKRGNRREKGKEKEKNQNYGEGGGVPLTSFLSDLPWLWLSQCQRIYLCDCWPHREGRGGGREGGGDG